MLLCNFFALPLVCLVVSSVSSEALGVVAATSGDSKCWREGEAGESSASALPARELELQEPEIYFWDELFIMKNVKHTQKNKTINLHVSSSNFKNYRYSDILVSSSLYILFFFG